MKRPATVVLLAFACACLCACLPQTPEKEEVYVTYAQFGAVGDGVTDDLPAIVRTHDYANEHGCAVRADGNARYYLGGTGTATVRTDTDWGNAEFLVDDRAVDPDDRAANLFRIASDKTAYNVELPDGYSLKAGQKSLGIEFGESVLLYLEDKDIKEYIRYGKNTNDGTARQEIVLADAAGNVDADTPILKDYGRLTKMTAYPADDAPITVRGGIFTTIANDAPISASYYGRGIDIRRSNTTLADVKHYVTQEGDHGSPYRGFYSVNYADNVTIENCVLTGHKVYTNIKPTGAVSQGTYDTQAAHCNRVTWRGCTQSNSVTDTAYWGVMASNFCKNLCMTGCTLSRFDAHQGVYNATVTDTVLGQILTIIGEGSLVIERVERLSGDHFLQLRADYGSTWKGEVLFSDCVMHATSDNFYLVQASWNDWDFGYPCYLPSVTVEGLRVEGAKRKYVFSAVTEKSATAVRTSKNPLSMPAGVTLIDTEEFALTANKTGLFDDVPLYIK